MPCAYLDLIIDAFTAIGSGRDKHSGDCREFYREISPGLCVKCVHNVYGELGNEYGTREN